MFEIGWAELLVIACVAIIVVGPKDLPRMLRTFGQLVGKMRRMASDFQSTVNDAIREAERQADIDDMRKAADAAANFNPLGDLKKSIEADRTGSKESPPVSPPVPVSAASSTQEQTAPVPASAPMPVTDPVPQAAEPVAVPLNGTSETPAAPASQDKTA
jgi:sec-independent protein translocase protein TatB